MVDILNSFGVPKLGYDSERLFEKPIRATDYSSSLGNSCYPDGRNYHVAKVSFSFTRVPPEKEVYGLDEIDC